MGSDASLWARWTRRSASLSAYGLACALAWAIAPVAFPLLAIPDAVRGSRWSRCRALAAALVYLSAEIAGVMASFALFVTMRAGTERYIDAHYRLQKLWASVLLRSFVRLYAIDLRVDAIEPWEGPSVCLVRHASLIDTLLPVVLIERRPRYVLKRELLADPCLDIVGQRIPNAFLTRRSEHAREDAEIIAALARDLSDRDVLVVYPEGTFFTPEKLAKRMCELAGERAERLAGLRHVLPPRPRGALAAFDACPDASALFLVHTGLEPLRSLRQLTDGSLVGARVSVSISSGGLPPVPREPEAFGAWLDERWQEIDAWIDARG